MQGEEAMTTFAALKESVLELPLLGIPSEIEADALGVGFGAGLMRQRIPLTFISQDFSDKEICV
jgi:hypothetical protein